ncbi:MAG: UvrD-helicase domain-containing protein [Clostridiales bacterium]|nr:UvrD-helicase domain-containing protein [Clostridiales bacterium]
MDSSVFSLEQAHFSSTLQTVTEERRKAEVELGITDGNDRFIQVIDDGSDDAVVQQFVLRMKLRSLHQLRLSERQPYFARLDFTPDSDMPYEGGMKAGKTSAVYVGRWGVIKTPEYKVCVADWRSPVANLYYSGQIGRVSYDAPDGKVEGDLSLKRMFTVEEGKLLGMQDTGLVGQERFLTEALSQVTTARLREVVTTIQAEQNTVIRHDPFSPLCVQGVAGSGKTTIALHRIAWMLYRLQKTVAPHQMMILAPNPLFLNYISRVLPDLGVEQVRQTTFAQLCEKLLGKRMPKLELGARLEERLCMSKHERDALDAVLRRKGALALGNALDGFLERFERKVIPVWSVGFGGRILLDTQEMEDLFLRQFRHYPLRVRVDEVRKVVKKRLKQALEQLEDSLRKATDQRLEALLRSLPDGEERQEKARRLLLSRQERLDQLKQAEKDFWRNYDQNWHPMSLLKVYGEFWQEQAALEGDGSGAAEVWAATEPGIAKGRVGTEDLPALLWLGERLYGYPRMDIRHVVVDEAQDVSPLQVKVLRKLFNHDAFTLVGDLWQGIYGDEGLRAWSDLTEGIFEKQPACVALSTSYRSTVEIMELALALMAGHDSAGVTKPVLRHGEPPSFISVKMGEECLAVIARYVEKWLGEGFFSIAIIVKREADAKALHKALLTLLPQAWLVSRGDDTFQGGVQVMGASVVKGLEFDCVLIADAQAEAYPRERFYDKLLYVLCTRPLHRLVLLGSGKAFRE